jgi:hypothetical protein
VRPPGNGHLNSSVNGARHCLGWFMFVSPCSLNEWCECSIDNKVLLALTRVACLSQVAARPGQFKVHFVSIGCVAELRCTFVNDWMN